MDDDNTSNKRRRQKFEAVRPDLEIIKREIEHAKDVDNEVGYNRGYQLESDSSQTDDSDDLRSQRMILDELLSLLHTSAHRRFVADLLTSPQVEFGLGLVPFIADAHIYMEVTSYELPNKYIVERLGMAGFELVRTDDAGSEWKLRIQNQIHLLQLCYDRGCSILPAA